MEPAPVRRAALAFVVLALAGCRSTHARAPRSGAIALRQLPAQGLVDEERRGVALRDMRGRRLVWLPGFAVHPRGASAQASVEYGFLSTRFDPPLLHGPKGWYRLDAARHALLPVKGGRLPLAGGATVVARRGPAFAVERGGRVILRASAPVFRLPAPDFRIRSQRLVQAGRTLLDVRTGRRWKLPPGCLFAGFRGETLIGACGVAHGAEGAAPLVVERIVPGGAAHPLTQALAQLVPEAASLSPDRTWVAVEGITGQEKAIGQEVVQNDPALPADEANQVASALNQGVERAAAVRKTPLPAANLWTVLGVPWGVGIVLVMLQLSLLRRGVPWSCSGAA